MDKFCLNTFNKIQKDFFNTASKAETNAKLVLLVELINHLINNLVNLGQIMTLYGLLDDIKAFQEEMEEY